MNKNIKVPSGLVSAPSYQGFLELDGCSVIESSIYSMPTSGGLFLEDHLLLFVLEGTNTLTHGKQSYTVRKNEMVLLKKAIAVKYEQQGNSDNDNIYDGLMFCLCDAFVKEFLITADIQILRPQEEITTTVNPMSARLIAFAHSLKPYFNDSSAVNPGLLRLKIMELLYNVAECSRNIFRQMVQIRQPARIDIRRVMEQNYATPATLPELAYLTGRSLSGFKRDFKKIYNMAPAQWIRDRRLEKAGEMLLNTALPVSDICYATGFENVSHFSRIFKAHYGQSPTDYRH